MQERRRLSVACTLVAIGSILAAMVVSPAQAGRPTTTATASDVGATSLSPTSSDLPPQAAAIQTVVSAAASPRCSQTTNGRIACVKVERGRTDASAPRSPSTRRALPTPLWCKRSLYVTRTEACLIYTITYTTELIVNGVPELTGAATLDAFSFSYASVNQPTIGHQLQVSTAAGWGDALKATVSGTARAGRACRLSNAVFAPQPLLPLKTLHTGESFYRTTATRSGAVGRCQTAWTVTFTNPTYTTASTAPSYMDQMRCDNATGTNGFRKARVGCVVFGYTTPVAYSRKNTPNLASHVSRAQKSGLPGGNVKAPLTRTTVKKIIDKNRKLACGKAPKIKNKQCDEYPLATTRQGLSAGGKLRTFAKCRIKASTRLKGAKGASACMIPSRENNVQGAIMARFFYDWRILNGDKYIVQIVK